VLEDSRGRLVGIEVKARQGVSAREFRGQDDFKKTVGRQFHRGFVLYLGADTVPFGRELFTLPVSAATSGALLSQAPALTVAPLPSSSFDFRSTGNYSPPSFSRCLESRCHSAQARASPPTRSTPRKTSRKGSGLTHLVFLPDRERPRFFLWGSAEAESAEGEIVRTLSAGGRRERARLVDESLVAREVEGTAIPVLDALPVLAAVTGEEAARVPASLATWSLGAKLALDLVGRERLVPRVLAGPDGKTEARFGVALGLPEDAERVARLAKALPAAAHAVPVESRTRRRAPPSVWAPEALLRAFLDQVADSLVRAAVKRQGAPATAVSRPKQAARLPWERRFLRALTSDHPAFEARGFQERTLLTDLEIWARPALGAEPGAPRGCLRLELPDRERRRAARDAFPLSFFLQAADDPSLLIPAADVWNATGDTVRHLGRTFRSPQEHLLRSLGVAARLFPPAGRSLRQARPEAVLLDPEEAWVFLTQAAPALSEAGLGVIVPAEFTRAGRRRLKLRMRVGISETRTAGKVAGASGLGLEELVAFQWEAALGKETLSARDLRELARLKAPLVRFRGQWVAVDPSELKDVERLLAEGGGALSTAEALAATLSGTVRVGQSAAPVEVAVEGRLAAVLERLRSGTDGRTKVPKSFRGKLRPYQERGLGWLSLMAELGLGACLADDMGLGKTIQMLAYLLKRREAARRDRRPALLVCPTSVVGNWEREIARFAPSLPVVRHYGSARARDKEELAAAPPGSIVLTSYGLLRRDSELLSAADWSVAVLDEAQNIKNAASRTARVARSLRATDRFALTGTPVENRLAELWSILEFANPRLLGALETFRREYAVPIERYQDQPAAERLRRIVRPFILRRLKSDPTIIQDLPPKQEMKVVCTLTREQATLYQATVDDALTRIESADGIRRRGMVLALLTALKQICNHPAQYLGESGPLARRSGKLDRLGEMLEEVLAAGDRALVFTQFREMGDRLVRHLGRELRTEVLYLHGGVARAARDAMVGRFQEEEERGPRIFVLSLKAGGTGLNLTAASHVFHFDRWWNPAVEDQATDRAYRIGQTRAVQVRKLLCSGTVEEKVDRLLESKRNLASRIVGAGEQWITELDDRALRELFSLSADAAVGVEEEP